jgi:hypothetical protein
MRKKLMTSEFIWKYEIMSYKSGMWTKFLMLLELFVI